jgi:hypothetical protein
MGFDRVPARLSVGTSRPSSSVFGRPSTNLRPRHRNDELGARLALVLGLGEDKPKLQPLLPAHPHNGPDAPSEDLSLVLGVASVPLSVELDAEGVEHDPSFFRLVKFEQ